jgi:predicted TIM-barrel fold metal-dependent hydrolase
MYQGGLSDAVVAPLAAQLHTAHNHSPLPILHLYLSNVFDRHSNLRVVLAHPCTFPALLVRINAMLDQIPSADRPKRAFLDV